MYGRRQYYNRWYYKTFTKAVLCHGYTKSVEYEGTYSLPEAQLDRFLLKLKMGYPTPEEEFEILNRMEKQIHSLNYRPLLQ